MLILKELRNARKVSQQKLADYLNISRSTVAMWESGASEPDTATLKKLATYFSVSIDVLVGQQPPALSNAGSGKWIPVLGRVAAGIPIEAIEDIADMEAISEAMAAKGEYFALKIKGDSMEPRICNNDVVIVLRRSDADSGDTCIVLINGDDAACKRIKKTPEGVLLISNNPKYEPIFFTNSEIDSLPVSILGVVVEVRGKLK